MWPEAILTGDPINVFFFSKERYSHFARPKKTGSNNEANILARWP